MFDKQIFWLRDLTEDELDFELKTVRTSLRIANQYCIKYSTSAAAKQDYNELLRYWLAILDEIAIRSRVLR